MTCSGLHVPQSLTCQCQYRIGIARLPTNVQSSLVLSLGSRGINVTPPRRNSAMKSGMTVVAESDQIIFRIPARVTAELLVVDFKVRH